MFHTLPMKDDGRIVLCRTIYMYIKKYIAKVRQKYGMQCNYVFFIFGNEIQKNKHDNIS